MEYIRRNWLWGKFPEKYGDDSTLPVTIYSEIDDEGYEQRKIEIFKGGKIGIANRDIEYCEVKGGLTGLSDQKMSSFNEMSHQTEVQAFQITNEEFEEVWNEHMKRYLDKTKK